MPRREFSKAVLRAALARADGRCEGALVTGGRCPCTLQTGRFDYDHIVPAALAVDASLENCQVLCRPCQCRQDGAGCRRDRTGAPDARSAPRHCRPEPAFLARQQSQPVQAPDRWWSHLSLYGGAFGQTRPIEGPVRTFHSSRESARVRSYE